jgi:predicted amidohydrolase
MKIALIQANLIWENPNENRNSFEEKIIAISQSIDLIVLPEMFTSGFTMSPSKVAETMQGETVVWLKNLAKARNCAITGSVVVEENSNFYNRMLFVYPSGEIKHYDKRHLFTLSGEDKAYVQGTEPIIIDYLGWRIAPFICYDLRFPVFSRNVDQYDLLIYVASWPKPRTNAWDVLLAARAIENMSCVVGVNRVGIDENGHEYIGHSQVIDGLGNYVLAPEEEAGTFIVTLDRTQLVASRTKLPFLNDQDSFEIRN